jgi:hypothetical protein
MLGGIADYEKKKKEAPSSETGGGLPGHHHKAVRYGRATRRVVSRREIGCMNVQYCTEGRMAFVFHI